VNRLAAAIAFLAISLVWTGGFAGWISEWRGARGRDALAQALSEAGTREDVERALTEAGRALDVNPLSREDRMLYQSAAEEAVARLGAARTIALAPEATLSRAVLAGILEGHGDAAAATAVRARIGTTRPEEIEVLNEWALRQTAIAPAVVERCREALPLLEAAVARAPDDAGLALSYAGCLNKLGQGSRSLPILIEIYERDPTSKWVHFLLAEAFLAVGSLDQADESTRWLTVRIPDFYLGWRLRGDVLTAMGRANDALESYRTALTLEPHNAWLKWRIGVIVRGSESTAPIEPSPPPSSRGCSAPWVGACS